jgi:tRNA-dihydrouridine synthase B
MVTRFRGTMNRPGARHIATVELENRLILAPMAGMLRLPVRLTYRRLGAAMTCIGVIDARAVVQSPDNVMLNILGKQEITCEEERPVSVQLVGAEAEVLARAARVVQSRGSVIDLDFSGPTRRLIDNGYGAAGLLRDPCRIKDIVAAVAGSVGIPVTAKIRIGFDGPDVDVVRIAQNCQEAGAAALGVHARFVRQMYCGPAHWEWIKRVRDEVDIPVIGNGAIQSPLDVRAMIEQTGCDFVMIGTAAFVNPLIFRQANELLETGRYRQASSTRALLEFFRHYFAFARRVESRSILTFLRRSCRDFLRVQAYMRKIQTGQTTLE